MRVLFAVHGYKPAYRVGGPIISVSAIAETLVRKGHEVIVFTSNSNLDEDLDVPVDQPVNVEGVEVWYFSREEYLKRWLPFVSYLSKSMGFLYSPMMRSHLQRLVPTVHIVHTHMPFVYPTYAAAKVALHYRKPLFYHQRAAFDPGRLKFRRFKKRLYIHVIERPIMRRATTLIALTESEVASYRALGVHTPCRVIPNGIDVEQYRQSPSCELIARWGIPRETLVILFLGRVHPIKGADRLLQAFLKIQSRFPRALLVIAGPDEWGVKTEFRNYALQAGVNDRVLFPGMVAGTDKLDLLARADLFCLPSTGEGFSIAVLEALASSTAVLLSPGCHFPEVEAAGAGRIAPLEVSALATVLAEMLEQPNKLRQMGQMGRQLVAQNYSWDRITDQLLQAYDEGIQRSRHTCR